MKHAYSSNLVMIAEMKVKAERLDEFFEYTVANLAVSRAYPGNISFEMLVDKTQPETVLFYEVWASAEAQKAYMAWRVEAGDLTALLSLLAEPPRFTAFNSVAA